MRSPLLRATAALFTVLSPASAQFLQQGPKLVGAGYAGGTSGQGNSIALSADGNTAVVGGPYDVSNPTFGSLGAGAVWVFTRTNGVWSQQGLKLTATGASGSAALGLSVAVSTDGNTLIAGGPLDANQNGAAWVFTRTNGVWSQQGPKLTPASEFSESGLGTSVALSGDGNTALVGGPDDLSQGAAWVFTRTAGAWSYQAKLIGVGGSSQGTSVALSTDGNTALVGGSQDGAFGAAWVFTRTGGVWSQQGSKLVGSAAAGSSQQGSSVSLSGDGNTAFIGGPGDSNNTGATWVFTRTGGAWSQLGGKLIGSSAAGPSQQGQGVALSTDGNTAWVGGPGDSSGVGATWVFTRSNGTWSQSGGKLVGGASGARNVPLGQGWAVALSSDGSTGLTGSPHDSLDVGAVWPFTQSVGVSVPAPMSVTPVSGTVSSQTMTFNFTDTLGYQKLGVVNILVNNFLDGRHACYLAYSQPFNTLYLVDDSGGLLPGSPLTAAGSTSNSQCTVSWGGSAVSASGNNLTLMLTIAFTASFAGNKVMYMAAGDVSGANSGWQPLGVWQVPGAAPATITVAGMSPAHGSGFASTPFTFNFTDTKGTPDLGVMNILVNGSLDGRHACYLAYARSINVLYLVNDNGDALLPGQILSAAGSTSNSQCAVTWGGTAVALSGNTLSLALNIAFTASFGGNRIFYLAARDNNGANNTDWQTLGTWSVQ